MIPYVSVYNFAISAGYGKLIILNAINPYGYSLLSGSLILIEKHTGDEVFFFWFDIAEKLKKSHRNENVQEY